MLHLAGNKPLRYIGEGARRLWEVGGRDIPMLKQGDIVIVSHVIAVTLSRRADFEMANDINITYIDNTGDAAPVDDTVAPNGDAAPAADMATAAKTTKPKVTKPN